MGNSQIQSLSDVVLKNKKANTFVITTNFGPLVVEWDGWRTLNLITDNNDDENTESCVEIEIHDDTVNLESLLYRTKKPKHCYRYQESGYAKYLLSQIHKISMKLKKKTTTLQDAAYSRTCKTTLTPYLWSTRGFGFYHSYGYLWRIHDGASGVQIDKNIDKNNTLIAQITQIIQLKSWLDSYVDQLAYIIDTKTTEENLQQKYEYDLLKKHQGKSISEISKETKSDIYQVIDEELLNKIDSFTNTRCKLPHIFDNCITYHEYYTIPTKTVFIKNESGIGGHFELHFKTNDVITRLINTNCHEKYFFEYGFEAKQHRSHHRFRLESLYIQHDSKWTNENIKISQNHVKLFRVHNSKFKICLTGSYGKLKFTRSDPLYWCLKPTHIIQYTDENKFELVLDSEYMLHPFIRGETRLKNNQVYNPYMTIDVDNKTVANMRLITKDFSLKTQLVNTLNEFLLRVLTKKEPNKSLVSTMDPSRTLTNKNKRNLTIDPSTPYINKKKRKR